MSAVGRTVPLRRGMLAIVLMAVGLGVIAALVADPLRTTSGPPQPVFETNNSGLLGLDLVALGVFVLVVGYLGWQLYQRFTSGRMALGTRLVLVITFYFVLAILFLLAVHAFAGSGGVSGPGSLPVSNPSGSGGGSGDNGVNTTPRGGPSGFPSGGPLPNLPTFSWFDFGILGLVALLGLLSWRYISYRLDTGPDSDGDDGPAQKLRAELLASLRRLESDPDLDPRATILALYQRLLLTLQPRFRQIPESTPREIERTLAKEFRVRAANARDLTRLFEEARYSSHPMTSEDAGRARSALAAVLHDLDPAAAHRVAAATPPAA